MKQILQKELTGVNQYFIHAKMCQAWGYEALFQAIRKESIEEMQHADRVIERILFLEGITNVTGYDKITIGQTVKEHLENDLGLELRAIPVIKSGIRICLELSTIRAGKYWNTSSRMRSAMWIGSNPSFT